jgi:hypothetical protein
MINNRNPIFAQGAGSGAGAPIGKIDPADTNTDCEWIATMEKVGFTVVVVKVPYCTALWQNSGFEETLGSELTGARLGSLDSVKWGNPCRCYFYVHSKHLVAALELIEARLAAIGLLPHVAIGYADQESNASSLSVEARLHSMLHKESASGLIRRVESLNRALPTRHQLPADAAAAPARPTGTEPRPLMPMSAVMWRLDLDEDDVLVLIEEGALLWAFDIAGPRAERRTVRVLTESIEDLVFSRKRPYTDDESEWQRVAGLIFPDRPSIVTCELARSLNCGRDYIMNMVHAREVKTVPGTRMRKGPNGSAQVMSASAKAWLRRRRLL